MLHYIYLYIYQALKYRHYNLLAKLSVKEWTWFLHLTLALYYRLLLANVGHMILSEQMFLSVQFMYTFMKSSFIIGGL